MQKSLPSHNNKSFGFVEAVFDNLAEWPDELAFRRGDILSVIDFRDQSTNSEKWWLCVDREGRRGIVPANRVRMMNPANFASRHERLRDRVITPRRFGDVFFYSDESGGSAEDSPFDLVNSFGSFSLLHGPNRAYPLSADRFNRHQLHKKEFGHFSPPPINRPGAVVRDIPIKIETKSVDQKEMNDRFKLMDKLVSHRGYPTGPQRKYFHLPRMTSTSSSDEERRNGILKNKRVYLDEPGPGSPMTRSLMTEHLKMDNNGMEQDGGRMETTPNNNNGRGPSSSSSSSFSSWLLKTPSPDDTTDSGVHMVQSPKERNHPKYEQHGSGASSSSPSASERSSLSDPLVVDNKIDSNSMTTIQSPICQPISQQVTPPSTQTHHPSVSFSDTVTTYDVPARNAADSAASSFGRYRTPAINYNKPPLAPKPTANQMNEKSLVDKNKASIIMNMLEGLYDMPGANDANKSTARSLNAKINSLYRDDNRSHSSSSLTTSSLTYPGHNQINSCNIDGRQAKAPSNKNPVIERLQVDLEKLELSAKRMREYTAARCWRQPHVLQQYLMDMRDTVTDVVTDLTDFVDITARLAISDTNSDQFREFSQLLTPLRDSKALVTRLKRTLDSVGWTLAALSRPRGSNAGNDSLDQFLLVVKQIPNDCRQMVKWAQGTSSIDFIICPETSQNQSIPISSENADNFPSSSTAKNSSSLVTDKTGNKESNLAETMLLKKLSNGSSLGSASHSEDQKSSAAKVIEEDDLGDSSDQQSLFDDYDFVDSNTLTAISNGIAKLADGSKSALNDERTQNVTDKKETGQNAEKVPEQQKKSQELSDEDKQIFGFYSPQISAHTKYLSSAIESFLTSVEQQQPPKEFVQKSKMVVLSAHKLVYIGDNVAQCVRAEQLSAAVQAASDRLCDMLKMCVGATKLAAENFPQVSTVQKMVDTVVRVSHAAHDLKLLVKHATANG